ncbi:Zinc finger, CCHC-type [Rhizoctonia solani]|uniref:Zinc finger, CCHC-type n=1 Tax=Rhizoctonia solani TaxID=456999 RepID=A0A8H8NQD1_9AGAM|nr:Zinc finger, CCHC-type [Rhizoctonia solani]QRW16852.1 Zinc finger, CCHC-type [Rhizoctonia solani]
MPLSREPHDEPRSNMQLSAPSWTSSSFTTSPRRPFAMTETPSSPSSSTASQKFEVKRLLSRPADPCGSRPLTLVSHPPTPEPTTSTKTQDDASTPKARQMPLDGPIPSAPSFTLADPAATTPASAYARAYAQRTQMAYQVDVADREHRPTGARSKSRPRAPSEPAQQAQGQSRNPFESPSGRVVAVGDSPPLALAAPQKLQPGRRDHERRRNRSPPLHPRSRENDSHMMMEGMGSRKERLVTRKRTRWPARHWFHTRPSLGSHTRSPVLSVVQSTTSSPRLLDQDAMMRVPRTNQRRLSRHLSIEDFRGLVRPEQEAVTKLDIWEPKNTGSKNTESRPEAEKSSDRDGRIVGAGEGTGEAESSYGFQVCWPGPSDGSHRIPASVVQKRRPAHHIQRVIPTPSLKCDSSSRRSTMVRSDSMPSECPRPTAITNDARRENKIWRLVKKMSTGTLKEKKSHQAEKAPPVPPLPTSRRSSVYDYGEEVRPDLARFATREPSTQPSRNRSASGGRPSLSHEWRPSMTNDSAPSSSPKSSFGKTQSPRTSMSSYIDLGEEIPPLRWETHRLSRRTRPTVHTAGPRTISTEQHPQRGVGASPSLPPPKRPRTAQKSRDKVGSSITPLSSPALSNAPTKPKPNVLRRPTRLNDDD